MSKEPVSTRFNITVDLETNKKLEDYAKKLGLSKAGMIRVMINEYIIQREVMENVTQLEKIMELMGDKK